MPNRKVATPKRNIIDIFEANGRKKQWSVRSLVPSQCVEAVENLLGKEAAKKARETMATMDESGMDFLQIRVGDRRIRFRQSEIA